MFLGGLVKVAWHLTSHIYVDDAKFVESRRFGPHLDLALSSSGEQATTQSDPLRKDHSTPRGGNTQNDSRRDVDACQNPLVIFH